MRIRLKAQLHALGVPQSALAKAVGVSAAVISQAVNHNVWPKTPEPDELRGRIRDWIGAHLASTETSRILFEEWPEPRTTATPADLATTQHDTQEADTMLLRHETLSDAAMRAWNLERSPFVYDINELADIFTSGETRRMRMALLDAAMNQRFIALIGESGSGKTTLREELEERIRIEDKPVIVIKPYVVEMSSDDTKGRMLKSGQIAEIMINRLAPSMPVRRYAQERLQQTHSLLINSHRIGYRHLLVIEEAHRMPVETLRQLKSFAEMKDGLQYLLGILLLGQPELAGMLTEHDSSVREIVQRVELRTMPALDNELPEYVAHKFARINANAADILADDALDAIRARLVRSNGPDLVSICYPLVVNNLLARAMNACAARALPKVTAAAIREC